ncbi:MAG: hypothetical protein NC484_00140 [Alloprevotella sp.]|nr:hypothetical protein [Alloprevotella sp.]
MTSNLLLLLTYMKLALPDLPLWNVKNRLSAVCFKAFNALAISSVEVALLIEAVAACVAVSLNIVESFAKFVTCAKALVFSVLKTSSSDNFLSVTEKFVIGTFAPPPDVF